MKIEPLGDKLLVRQFDAKTQTDGGILLPQQAQLKPLKGTVLAVGPGRRNEDGSLRPMNVNVGDTVLFGKYAAGITITVDEEELILMNEPDVLAREVHPNQNEPRTGSCTCERPTPPENITRGELADMADLGRPTPPENR